MVPGWDSYPMQTKILVFQVPIVCRAMLSLGCAEVLRIDTGLDPTHQDDEVRFRTTTRVSTNYAKWTSTLIGTSNPACFTLARLNLSAEERQKAVLGGARSDGTRNYGAPLGRRRQDQQGDCQQSGLKRKDRQKPRPQYLSQTASL